MKQITEIFLGRERVRLQRNNSFQKSDNLEHFKEIKRLKSLEKAEVDLEPKPASTMEFFCEQS